MILTVNISVAYTILMHVVDVDIKHVVVADAVLIIRVPVPDFYFQIKYNIIRCSSAHQPGLEKSSGPFFSPELAPFRHLPQVACQSDIWR